MNIADKYNPFIGPSNASFNDQNKSLKNDLKTQITYAQGELASPQNQFPSTTRETSGLNDDTETEIVKKDLNEESIFNTKVLQEGKSKSVALFDVSQSQLNSDKSDTLVSLHDQHPRLQKVSGNAAPISFGARQLLKIISHSCKNQKTLNFEDNKEKDSGGDNVETEPDNLGEKNEQIYPNFMKKGPLEYILENRSIEILMIEVQTSEESYPESKEKNLGSIFHLTHISERHTPFSLLTCQKTAFRLNYDEDISISTGVELKSSYSDDGRLNNPRLSVYDSPHDGDEDSNSVT